MPLNVIVHRLLVTGFAGAAALLLAATGSVPAHALPAMRHMSLQEKVGQLFVQNVYGSDAITPDARNLPLYGVASPAEVVAKYHLGGVVYFAWTDSVQNPPQIVGLSNGLQRAAIGSGAHIPLMIATDQEQGVVTRIGPPATQFPGSMALGAARRSDDARTAAAITGQELKAMGINVDYAPDADVNVNALNPVIGTRSFSSDPALVASMVAAQVKGYQKDAGIIATPKHFPGHGDTATDSHTGIPVITDSLAMQGVRDKWLSTQVPDPVPAPAPGARQLLLGDFSAEPGAPELDPLWQSVRDVWADAPARSGTGLTYPAAVPTKRIDYVTASPNIALLAAATPADDLAGSASDHRPIVATVQIPRGSEHDR